MNRLGKRLSKWAARFPLIVTGLVSALAGGVFVNSSLASSSVPRDDQFDGFVVFLQDTTSLGSGQQIRLTFGPLSHGPRPRVGVGLAACGEGAISGHLIFGGDARMTDVTFGLGDLSDGRLQFTSKARLSGASFDGTVPLGDIQSLAIDIPKLDPCISTVQSDDAGFVGRATRIEGNISAPIVSIRKYWPFTSPRIAETMPLMGAMPDRPLGDSGEFEIPELTIQGAIIPPGLFTFVEASSSNLNALTEIAQPELKVAPSPHWSGQTGFQARRTVLDQAQAQQLATVSAAATLVFGTFSATFLSILSRSRQRLAAPSSPHGGRRVPGARTASFGSTALSSRLVRRRSTPPGANGSR